MPLGSQLSNNFPTSKCHKMGLQLYNGRWNNFITFTYVGWNKKHPVKRTIYFGTIYFGPAPSFPFGALWKFFNFSPKKPPGGTPGSCFASIMNWKSNPALESSHQGWGIQKKDGGMVVVGGRGWRMRFWYTKKKYIMRLFKKDVCFFLWNCVFFFFFSGVCFAERIDK